MTRLVPPFMLVALIGAFFGSFFSAQRAQADPDNLDRNREALLKAIETSFQEDCLRPWYPRVKDEKFGGYLSRFDADWDLSGSQDKFIVSQARHVWATSEIGLFTGESMYRELAEHGYRFLRDTMWDRTNGGFFSRVTRRGKPQLQFGKSAYGNAFAIYGLARFHALTGNQEALELAKRTFRWLDERSWDEQYGGYVDRLNIDGSWAGETVVNDTSNPTDHIGLKDYNSTIHILEAFTALYHEWPDPQLKERLEAVLEQTRDRFTTDKGYLHLYFHRDWTPVSFREAGREAVLEHLAFDHVSWGHDVETAFLMLEAEHALGRERDPETLRVAKKMVDHALATGWDEEKGGLFESGYYFDDGGPVEVVVKDKVWWIAAEAMNALLMMSQLFPDEPRYWEAFRQQWDYNQKYMIDQEHGGWFENGLDTNPEAVNWPKAHIWKTSYHVARAYMNCIQMLKNEFPLTTH